MTASILWLLWTPAQRVADPPQSIGTVATHGPTIEQLETLEELVIQKVAVSDILAYPIAAVGNFGPNLLPGLGTAFNPPKMHVVICASCGLIRLFAAEGYLKPGGSTASRMRS